MGTKTLFEQWAEDPIHILPIKTRTKAVQEIPLPPLVEGEHFTDAERILARKRDPVILQLDEIIEAMEREHIYTERFHNSLEPLESEEE